MSSLETDYPLRQDLRCREWFRQKGEEQYRLDYPLTRESVVFDVGGYRGEWAEKIWERFGCQIFIFEPVLEFYELIKKKFEGNPKVRAFPFGLGDREDTLRFSLDLDRTSSLGGAATTSMEVEAHIRPFLTVVQELGLDEIHLLKMNIEGGEYPLLKHLIGGHWASRVHDFQIQFHDFFPEAATEVAALRQELWKTHYPTFQFDFVWENWRRLPRLREGHWEKVLSDLQWFQSAWEQGQKDILELRMRQEPLELELKSLKKELANEIQRHIDEVADYKNSSSWKLTQPLRDISSVLQKFKSKF